MLQRISRFVWTALPMLECIINQAKITTIHNPKDIELINIRVNMIPGDDKYDSDRNLYEPDSNENYNDEYEEDYESNYEANGNDDEEDVKLDDNIIANPVNDTTSKTAGVTNDQNNNQTKIKSEHDTNVQLDNEVS